MAINLQTVECFVVSAQCGSFRAAADQMFRSYQSVYQSVRQLEDALGSPLFIQENGKLRLTGFGAYVLEHAASPLLKDYQKLQRSAEDYERLQEKSLTVAMDSLMENDVKIGQSAIELLRQRHPESHIQLLKLDHNVLLSYLQDHTADLCFRMRTPLMEDMLPCLSIPIELCLYVSKAHRLANQTAVTIEDLKHESFLFHNPVTYRKMSFWAMTGLPVSQAILGDVHSPLIQTLFQEGRITRVFPRFDKGNDRHTHFLNQGVCLSFDPPLYDAFCFYRNPVLPPKRLMGEYLHIFRRLYEQEKGIPCSLNEEWNAPCFQVETV